MKYAPHNNEDYVLGLQQNKKEYHFWKNDLTSPFTEAHKFTTRTLRPNFETMKRQNEILVNSKISN